MGPARFCGRSILQAVAPYIIRCLFYITYQQFAVNVPATLVTRLADRRGDDPADLPPLADAIDPEVLEKLVESTDESATVQFSYLDHEVAVDGDGTVRLTERPRRD